MLLPVKTVTMVVHNWIFYNVYLLLNMILLGQAKDSGSSADDFKNNEEKNIATCILKCLIGVIFFIRILLISSTLRIKCRLTCCDV